MNISDFASTVRNHVGVLLEADLNKHVGQKTDGEGHCHGSREHGIHNKKEKRILKFAGALGLKMAKTYS